MTGDNSVPKSRVVPEPSDYRVALDRAWSELSARNPEEVASCADVELIATSAVTADESVYRVPFMDETIAVRVADRTILRPNGSELASFKRVLVLHYLLGATAGPASDEWVTFRELEAGRFYLPAFRARAIEVLEPVLGPRPDRLLPAAAPLGGKPMEFGDASASIVVMPKVCMGIVVWAGDDEFAPEVSMLFGRTAAEILPTEDLAVVGGLVASRLAKNVRG